MINEIKTRRLIVTIPECSGEDADEIAALLERRHVRLFDPRATVEHLTYPDLWILTVNWWAQGQQLSIWPLANEVEVHARLAQLAHDDDMSLEEFRRYHAVNIDQYPNPFEPKEEEK